MWRTGKRQVAAGDRHARQVPRRKRALHCGLLQDGDGHRQGVTRRPAAATAPRRRTPAARRRRRRCASSVGNAARSTSKRRALASCGTRQTSASVGVSPWQKRPVAGSRGEAGLDRLEADVAPVAVPAVLLRRRHAQRAGQVVQHPQVVERVDLAGDRQRQRAHPRARGRRARQQRRRRMHLVQPLDDRERLRQHVALVGDQRRHEALRIEREVGVGELRVAAQVDEHALRGEPLEVQRDAHAVRGRRAEVVVELHGG